MAAGRPNTSVVIRTPQVPTTSRIDPLLGSVVHGRYRIVQRVAVGGMGSVYRASELGAGREVAIKVVAVAALSDPVTLKRFETEVAIISTLQHPATLKLHDYGELEDGRPFLVTEFLHGVSFEEALLSRPFTPTEILSVLVPVCDALSEAHERGIVHRDLKPENIFLQNLGDRTAVRVLDFGIAKLGHRNHTHAGSVCGTPAYMSPEQAQGQSADARSDVYGLGVLAYRALVGRPPFDGEEPMSVLLKQIQERPIPLRQALAWPELPYEVEWLVMSMLEKSPDRRPASTAVVKSHIQHILANVRLPARPGDRVAGTAGALSTAATGLPVGSWLYGNLYRLAGVALIGLALSIVAAAWLFGPDVHGLGQETSSVVVDPIDPPLSAFDDLPPLPVVPDRPEMEPLEADPLRP